MRIPNGVAEPVGRNLFHGEMRQMKRYSQLCPTIRMSRGPYWGGRRSVGAVLATSSKAEMWRTFLRVSNTAPTERRPPRRRMTCESAIVGQSRASAQSQRTPGIQRGTMAQ